MQKMLFIVNPYAGLRRANRYLPEIIAHFNSAGYEVTAYMTSGPGNGAEIAAQRAADFDLVVCAGGDGTLNETITGVLRAGADVPIGYIPCGSTNDFATTLGLPSNVLQAAKAITEGQAEYFDVGKFNDRFFSYVASFGAFTKSSYSTPQNIKNALGHLAYILDGIQEIPQIRNIHVRLDFDGETIEDDFIFGAISNSTSVGGVLTLDPRRVDLKDGKFELLLVRVPKDMTELSECITALRNQEYDCKVITFRSVSRLTVYPEPGMAWTLDGEKDDGGEEIRIENLTKAIRLIRREDRK